MTMKFCLDSAQFLQLTAEAGVKILFVENRPAPEAWV